MNIKGFTLSVSVLLLCSIAVNSYAKEPITAKATTNVSVEVVEQFIQAFNEHSIEQLLSHTTDTVHWFNISGSKMLIETSSKNELGAAMADYFQTLPDAKATLTQAVSSANYVSTVEKVTWSHDGEQDSQCSIGVYELKQGKINAVWYYPAHACDPEPSNSNIVQPEIGLLKDTRQ